MKSIGIVVTGHYKHHYKAMICASDDVSHLSTTFRQTVDNKFDRECETIWWNSKQFAWASLYFYAKKRVQ